MMHYYYVKSPGIWGVPPKSVEKFADAVAPGYLLKGQIERFDPKKKEHAGAPGAKCALDALEMLEAEEYAALEQEEKGKSKRN